MDIVSTMRDFDMLPRMAMSSRTQVGRTRAAPTYPG